MNPTHESINLSEPFLSDPEKKKSQDADFSDLNENPSSDYQSFENLPKSKSCIFKSFSEEKQTINSDKSAHNSTKMFGIQKSSHHSYERKRVLHPPLRSIND